jgi:hypothetical protein
MASGTCTFTVCGLYKETTRVRARDTARYQSRKAKVRVGGRSCRGSGLPAGQGVEEIDC